MTGTAFLAILLLLAGTFLGVPVAIVLAIVVLLLEVVRAVWARLGLARVTLPPPARARPDDLGRGDPDRRSRSGTGSACRSPGCGPRTRRARASMVRERSLVIGGRGGRVLRNAWTLAPFERVTRQFHVGAERRGVVRARAGRARGRRPVRARGRDRAAAGRRPVPRPAADRPDAAPPAARHVGRPGPGAGGPERGSVAVRRRPGVRAGRPAPADPRPGERPARAAGREAASSRHDRPPETGAGPGVDATERIARRVVPNAGEPRWILRQAQRARSSPAPAVAPWSGARRDCPRPDEEPVDGSGACSSPPRGRTGRRREVDRAESYEPRRVAPRWKWRVTRSKGARVQALRRTRPGADRERSLRTIGTRARLLGAEPGERQALAVPDLDGQRRSPRPR